MAKLASPAAWWRWLRQWRRTRLDVDRAAVLAHVHEGGQLRPRYGFMIVMSCAIATLGLLQDSVAVIIGAMLISPLMGPIVEMGLALAVFDLRALRRALTTLAVGLLASLAVAWSIVALSPLQDATPQILARTEPTLFDLLVAVFSGLAGAYATITRKGEAIVGVAIATALMPPLAVVGFGLAVGNGDVAGGAAFLFMTNLLAIALSVTVMARWYGFAQDDSPRQTAVQAVLIVGCVVVLSIPLGLALREIAGRSVAERSVRGVLEDAARAQDGRMTSLRVERDGDGWAVDAVLLVPRHRSGLEARLAGQLQRDLQAPVRVRVHEVLTATDAALRAEQATLAELRASVARLQDNARREEAPALSAALDGAVATHLGRWQVQADGTPHLLLHPAAGLDLATARALEQALQGHDARAQVVPTVTDWPAVAFADDAALLEPSQARRVDDAAWALHRLGYRRVALRGYGGTQALARARAKAVAARLPAGLVAVTAVATATEQRAQAVLHGASGLRAVHVTPLAGPAPVTTPPPGP